MDRWQHPGARVGADAFISGTGLFGERSLKGAVKKMRKLVDENAPQNGLNLQPLYKF